MQILKKITSSTALKQSLFMIVGNTTASAIAAIALILYSRLLGPEKFGIFSVGFAVVQLIARLGDGGINIAVKKFIAQYYETDQQISKSLLFHSQKLKVGLAIFLGSIFFLFSKQLSLYWLKTDNAAILQLAVIFSLINIAFDYIAVIHQSIQSFTHSVMMNILQAILKACFGILLWVTRTTSPLIAFIVYSISPFVGVVYGLVTLPKWLKSKIPASPAGGQNPKSKHMSVLMGTIKFTSIAVLASAIGDNIDVLIVKSYLDNYQTGLYSAGARISILLSIIGYSLGTVLSTRVARYQDLAQLRSYLRKSFSVAGVILLSSLLIVPLTKYLIIFTAGSQYLAATGAVQLLIIAALVTAATTPFVSLFYLFDKPSYFAVSGIVQTIILVAGNALLIPVLGITGAGWSKLGVRLVIMALTIVYSSVMIKKQYRKNIVSFSFSS